MEICQGNRKEGRNERRENERRSEGGREGGGRERRRRKVKLEQSLFARSLRVEVAVITQGRRD